MTQVRLSGFRSCHKTVALVAALFGMFSAACKKGAPEGAAGAVGEPEPDEAPAPPSVRPQLSSVRQLLSETERAELDAGGLLIDFGTTDQHKYTLGGWQNAWHGLKAADDGATSTAITARSASVLLSRRPAPGRDVRQIVLRARAPGGARLSLAADGKALGNLDVPDTFSTVSLAVPAGAMATSARKLDLVFQGSGKGIRAELDWLWLGEAEGATAPTITARVAPIALGTNTRRALAAATPRTYSFFLQVPAAAKLVFDYGADQNTKFVVTATADGQQPVSLFEGEARPNRWLEGVADLAALAGKVVRLDLSTTGPGNAGWGDPEIMVAPGDKPSAPLARRAPRNVIVLVIDTVRADVFKAFNPDSRVATPAFDALAAESTTFVNALANENWTKPSVATILSGLYPVTHQTKRDPDVLNRQVRVLPEHLREEGFKTAAFIANGYVSEKFGFERGWDHYTNYIRENKVSEAEKVYGEAWKWVEKNGSDRFFMYIQTIDPHVPYAVPDSYLKQYFPEPYNGTLPKRLDGGRQVEISSGKRKITDEDERWIRALYDAEVTYHDKHMGDFFEALRGKGILDDTLVIVTNDHGEEIGEHERYGHGHSLYEELVRAPLTMRYPAMIPANHQVTEVVENVDIFPTILDVLELRAVPGLEGFSLLPWLEGRPPMTPSYGVSEFLDNYRAVRVGTWKLIATPSGGGKLFDLASAEGEQKDLADSAPIARRVCELHLAEALAVPSKPARFGGGAGTQRRFKPGQVKQDPELRRQLEALGYFGENK